MPLFSFLLFVIITSFTPGPNNFMAMAFANKHGFKKTMNFCLGVGVGFFVITLLCSYFNIVLKSAMPVIELPLTIFGASYMLFLAFKIVTSNDNVSEQGESNKNYFLIGILLQFVNPKGILFGITVVGNLYSSLLRFLFQLFSFLIIFRNGWFNEYI